MKYIVCVLLSGAMLLGLPCCSNMSVREAQRTVAVADSLRVNEGVAYDDSAALAEAYGTLGRWRMIYPDDYARACYYYGRMLRNRGDQVGAMQAFISGTHAPYVQRVVPLPWFNDHHILGRIYSNIGTMCHLVDEFQLGFDMYEQSAQAFRKANDTTAYYYALNAMALEYAGQKLHDETLALLCSIEQECSNSEVLTKLWETRAILYHNIELYDSAIYAAKQLYMHEYPAATGYVVEAQSFWHLQQFDSALYYARQVMMNPYAANQDRYHVLYILINNDTNIDRQAVQSLASERADLDSEYIEPLLQKLSVATDQLKQDIGNTPPFHKLLLILVSVVLAFVTAWVIIARFSKKARFEIIKHKQLIKENDEIRKSSENIRQQYTEHHQKLLQKINDNCKALNNSPDWKQELHWKDYFEFCKAADHYFQLITSKLKVTYNLDEKEIRLCVLILLDTFSNKQLAQHLNYSISGIGTFKYRVSQKFNIQSKDLHDFLLELAISGIQSTSQK